MGHCDHGAAVIRELGHEQAVLHECFDQLAARARRQVGPRRALATDRRLTILPDAHQRIQDLRQCGFDDIRKILEYGFCALRERTLDTAELAVRGQREHAVLGTALVQLLEGELQQGQDFAVPGRGIAKHVVQALAAGRILLEAQARRTRRQANHLADLAGVRRHQVVLPRTFLQRADLRVVGKPRIEVAAQGADDPDPPASRQRIEDVEERLPMPGRDLLLRVHLLHLIDDQREPGVGLARRLLLASQGIAYERRRRLRRFPQYLRKLVGPLAFLVQRGQCMLTQQRLREPCEELSPDVRRPEHRASPEPDAFDDTWLRQHRQNAGADDGGLAAAAHAEDQDESATVGRLLPQRLQDIGHRLRPAEENGRVLELERGQSTEWRTLLPDRARLRRRVRTPRKMPIDQLTEVVLEQNFEVARRLERMKGRDQGSFGLVVEPPVDETVEFLLLSKPVHQVLFVVQPDRWRRGLAVDEQVRLAAPAKAFYRFLEFVLGAGFVSRSVLALELLGKPGPETRPENRNDDIGVRRLDDLVLEGRGGDERFVLPKDGLEHDPSDVLALQAFDDPPG